MDWYHATEHLGQAKQLCYPEPTPQATRWYNALELALFQGHADQVVQALTTATPTPQTDATTEALRKARQYFQNNQRRMQYQELRDQGWPIGSGMVESAAKQFKHRFTGPGMRWSRTGAENLFPVRAAVMTSKARFDDLWHRAVDHLPVN